jgi:PRTRC genetic system protein C
MGLKPRVFIHKGERLADPDPGMKPADVRDHYAAKYPELANATFEFKKDGANDIYTFKTSAGTKG